MLLVAPGVGAGLYGVPVFGHEFPAAAPSLVGAALSGSAGLCAWLFVPETLRPSPASEAEEAGRTVAEASVCSLVCRWPFPLLLGLRTSLGVIEMATNDVVPSTSCRNIPMAAHVCSYAGIHMQ